MTTRFTGWHITAILIAFFGVVIGVNLWMAVSAHSTFGGALARNGYVASQDYNRWIEASEAQAKLGWSARAGRDGERLAVETRGAPGATLTVVIRHPLGRAPEQALAMSDLGGGRFMSRAPLPAGRWKVHLELARGAERARFITEIGG